MGGLHTTKGGCIAVGKKRLCDSRTLRSWLTAEEHVWSLLGLGTTSILDLRRMKGPVMLGNILWIAAVVVIIGAIFSLFRGFLKWGIILLIVALLLGGFGFFV